MKKTLGYGYRLASESLAKALAHYSLNDLHKSKKSVKTQIRYDRDVHGVIGKSSKAKVFKVIIEGE